eukprot:CAMPEP_0115337518 /NCGR_PEP_ID=MMETSP0270-20121206/89576_1 /TAXON_ID=71861 /ORGANISM="Scrippsiella trochoidea, Strain CCMP3099" /LENGTH=43 /DNA_ID= /DNA_START= /DNA_END= /DNA_ORIENTATION=
MSSSLVALVEPGLEVGTGRLLVDPRVQAALGSTRAGSCGGKSG